MRPGTMPRAGPPPPPGPTRETETGADLRGALRRFVTGVTVVTTLDDAGVVVGLTANSFTSVSLDPPLVLVCLGLESRSYEHCLRRGRFVTNVLAGDQGEVARGFAVRGGCRTDVCRWRLSERGYPILEGSLARFECELVNEVRAGDHAILIGLVVAFDVRDDVVDPLVFHDGRLFGLDDRES